MFSTTVTYDGEAVDDEEGEYDYEYEEVDEGDPEVIVTVVPNASITSRQLKASPPVTAPKPASFPLSAPSNLAQSNMDEGCDEKTALLRSILEVPKRALELEKSALERYAWIPDPQQAYRKVRIHETNGGKTTVSHVNGGEDDVGGHSISDIADKRTVETKLIQPASLSHYCADMAALTELNEPSVLHTIRLRYTHKLIHTYSGLFCVVVNPWEEVPQLYSRDMIHLYDTREHHTAELPPHVYAVAQRAYDGVATATSFASLSANSGGHKRGQSILITGESGAGKTENTKKIIEYLISAASSSSSGHLPTNCADNSIIGGLDAAILNAGVALEAFSNAKTVHNDNSSRLGKFIRIDFDRRAKICSAKIDCYLLEKSRVVAQNVGDRNFHIFYQLFQPTLLDDSHRARRLGLKLPPSSYRFLNQGGATYAAGIDDATAAAGTLKAMRKLGFTSDDIGGLTECLAACILIGELKFSERIGYDQSFVEDLPALELVAALLGLNSPKLIDALTQPSIRVGESIIKRSQNLRKTLFSASAFAKVLYERLFGWVVEKCNAAIERESSQTGKTKSKGTMLEDNGPSEFIGVLDMAGFEIMAQNSFEQFCINYTNERLQQFFNTFAFVREQQEYLAEGIDWREVDFGLDLQPAIDMIEQPMGLLALLQEECIVPSGSDASLLEKLVKNIGKSKSYAHVFAKAKLSSKSTAVNHFIVQHYAGQVAYNIDGWLEKNRDLVDQSLLDVLSTSEHALVSKLFPSNPLFPTNSNGDVSNAGPMTRSRRGSLATATVSYIYKEQLTSLLHTLNSTSAHFIRCLVPNYERCPFALNGPLVMHQLRCNGVLEGIRICRRGYPNREFYAAFYRRYSMIAANDSRGRGPGLLSDRERVAELCAGIGIDPLRYQLGRTKIFCKAGLVTELESLRSAKIDSTLAQLQAHARWYLEQRRVGELRRQMAAVLAIQEAVRYHVGLKRWDWYRLWLKVRPLIPLAADKKRLKELEEENLILTKQNRAMKMELEQLKDAVAIEAQKRRAHEQQCEDERQRNDELRSELKRNEDLLELMEKKFDEQHAKVMRLNGTLKENMRAIERVEEEKRLVSEELTALLEKHRAECEERRTLEENFRANAEECATQLAQIDSLQSRLHSQNGQLHAAEERVEEWRDKIDAEKELSAELQRHIAELNERVSKAEATVHTERSAKRKYEMEIDQLEEEVTRLKEVVEKAAAKSEAVKEQLRVKNTTIRKLERKLEDKCLEMDDCVAEMKKIHKASLGELQSKLDDYKRRCMKLESESSQLKTRLDAATAQIEREASVEPNEYVSGRNSALGRYGSRQSIGGTNSMTNSTISMGRSIGSRRRETEPELVGLRPASSHHHSSLIRSPSNSSATSAAARCLSRTATLSNMTVSLTNTLDSGACLARSTSTSTHNLLQLQASEKKVLQLERELQQLRSDSQLAKRELDVYRLSLQESERGKDTMKKQIATLTTDLDKVAGQLKAEEERNQQLEFDARRAMGECDTWKKRLEDHLGESKAELMAERKKHNERMEELKHDYELKLHHYAVTQRTHDELQSRLTDTESRLDKAHAQLAQMERMQRSQTAVGETWEAQYRAAMQEVEGLRDENAALKSKIRRQYRQIELLTQQSELDSCVSDLETRVDQFHDRLVDRSASSVSCNSSSTAGGTTTVKLNHTSYGAAPNGICGGKEKSESNTSGVFNITVTSTINE